MDKKNIENALMKMGIPAGVKGFAYIVDAVEYINQNPRDISVTKELYPHIAKKHNTTSSRVERAIRHAFEIARSSKGDYEMVEKYIGFINCANFNSLVMLQKKIEQECKENIQKEESDIEINKTVEEPNSAITVLELVETLRNGLKTLLSELEEI